MCERCARSIFGYHITDRAALESIRVRGMSSLITRTRSWTASVSGSFAKDREITFPGKVSSKFVEAVLLVMRAGISASTIVGQSMPGFSVMLDVPVTGSIDDNVQLDEELNDGIKQYCDQVASGPVHVVTKTKVSIADGKATAALLSPSHYLHRLAESYVHWRFAIEEKITGHHVYFFVSNHKAVYQKYFALCGSKENVVLLRVKLCNVSGHVPDQSDGDAIMTPHNVLASHLECAGPNAIFEQGLPPEDTPGANIKLWEAKGVWAAI